MCQMDIALCTNDMQFQSREHTGKIGRNDTGLACTYRQMYMYLNNKMKTRMHNKLKQPTTNTQLTLLFFFFFNEFVLRYDEYITTIKTGRSYNKCIHLRRFNYMGAQVCLLCRHFLCTHVWEQSIASTIESNELRSEKFNMKPEAFKVKNILLLCFLFYEQ